jgi:tetratricopeptide (TPR) repeat protein
MDQRLLFAVLLSLSVQAGYSSCAKATQELQSAPDLQAKLDHLKIAQAKPEANPAAPGAPPAASAKPADKPAEQQAGNPAAQKPQEAHNPAFAEHNDKGADLYKKSKYDEALTEFNQALELIPNNTVMMNWIGLCYQGKNDQTKAAEMFEKIIELDPDYADVHNNLGHSYYVLQDYEKSEKAYKRAIELNPKSADFHYNFARLLQQLQRWEEAVKEFEETLKLDPTRTEVFLDMGNIYRELKDYDKALQYYDKALDALKKAPRGNKREMAQTEAAIGAAKALIRKDKGDRAGAKEELEKLLDLDPGSYEINLNLGIIALEDKDYGNCLNYLARALERNPYDAAVHYWLGRYYYGLDSMKNSIKHFTDAGKLDELEHKFNDLEEWLDKAKKKQAGF